MSRRLAALALAVALAPQVAAADPDDPISEYTCKAPPASSKLSVTFKPETDLRDLVTWAVGFTCKNIIIDSAAQKYGARMTILAPKSMTPKQALALFVDAVEATGLVVVQKADTIIIKLGPKTPRDCSVASTGGSAPPTMTPVPPPPPADEGLTDADLAAGIRTIDATHREIDGALLDRMLANPMALAKTARFVPAVKNGKPNGFKLYAIRMGSLWARLGFANGDTLVTINGMDLSSADKALEVYVKLRELDRWDVQLERAGKPLTLTISIKR